ncbi:MAG: hypothetical protein ACK55I_14540, partial [bacterium]
GEAGAMGGEQLVAEVGRGDVELGDEVFVEVGENGFLQMIEDALRVLRSFGLPIDWMLEVGDWREDVEGVVSLGRHGWIRGGGAVEVKTEVVGKGAAFEYVLEQSAVAGSEKNGVMGDVFVTAVGGKIEDEETHGVFARGEF